ncbi:patatin-like phospholipase family protein [Massilia sp. TS11]|uniref:patatin-like phospholipase family protein n=1 Tax=Massilia sp. TS11 TaxID=2908003 RepID=UPI001EDB8BE7|nr:patatin-like phospholipase family protein [Massilia sp. TS11]MCG2584446.1 patatin-like phospholipase family protein [Massilia sp. TS11]
MSSALNPHGYRVVLVLQGGGALGAFQAGVFHAMFEHGLAPDWVVGTSIGAINGALIAGNTPARSLERLRSFWTRIAQPDSLGQAVMPDWERRASVGLSTFDAMLRGVPGFFEPRAFSGFPFGLAVRPEEASFYDTSPLVASLAELVDFDVLNQQRPVRLTINAVRVTTGELAHFDSAVMPLTVAHVRASGALPPAFPAVRIDGELYWDGGLYSNTPLESVLADLHGQDTLCFMVDLWNARGTEPHTLDEVQTRQKDVLYASRSRRHIADYVRTYQLQRKLRELYQRLPAQAQTEADRKVLDTLGCDSTLHVVHVPYRAHDWHMALKDVNFSKGSLDWRWDQGYTECRRTLERRAWLDPVAEAHGVLVHELPPPARRRQTD